MREETVAKGIAGLIMFLFISGLIGAAYLISVFVLWCGLQGIEAYTGDLISNKTNIAFWLAVPCLFVVVALQQSGRGV